MTEFATIPPPRRWPTTREHTAVLLLVGEDNKADNPPRSVNTSPLESRTAVQHHKSHNRRFLLCIRECIVRTERCRTGFVLLEEE